LPDVAIDRKATQAHVAGTTLRPLGLRKASQRVGVGIMNSAPAAMLLGQRWLTAFCFV
jgi:hypothetical protein